jgi:hypothetical protein
MAIGGDLRVGSRSQGDGCYSSTQQDNPRSGPFASLSVGARYFSSLDDITPFVGGGLSWSGISAEKGSFDGSGTGMSAHVDAGVEFLRTHKTHLSIGLRANLRCMESNPRTVSSPPLRVEPPTTLQDEDETEKKHVVPVSLAATVLF